MGECITKRAIALQLHKGGFKRGPWSLGRRFRAGAILCRGTSPHSSCDDNPPLLLSLRAECSNRNLAVCRISADG